MDDQASIDELLAIEDRLADHTPADAKAEPSYPAELRAAAVSKAAGDG